MLEMKNSNISKFNFPSLTLIHATQLNLSLSYCIYILQLLIHDLLVKVHHQCKYKHKTALNEICCTKEGIRSSKSFIIGQND